MGDILLSRDVMMRLGYNPAGIFETARKHQEEFDMDAVAMFDEMDKVNWHVLAAVEYEDGITPEEEALIPEEDEACFPEVQPDFMSEKTRLMLIASYRERLRKPRTMGAVLTTPSVWHRSWRNTRTCFDCIWVAIPL